MKSSWGSEERWKALLFWGRALLEAHRVPFSQRESYDLLAALEKRHKSLSFAQATSLYKEWIGRRSQREPFAYIVEEVEFLGVQLRVAPSVLIPRQETEILASLVTKEIGAGSLHVWDLCCGSGALALAIKKWCPLTSVVGVDLSSDALELARENGLRNSLTVEWLEGDLLAPLSGRRAEVILSNPPYIFEEEYPLLEEEVRLYEPQIALIGGLSFYQRLAEELPPFLEPGARLYFEIPSGRGGEIQALFAHPHWKGGRVIDDWSGQERFFFLGFSPESMVN